MEPLPFGHLTPAHDAIIQKINESGAESCVCHWDALNRVLDESKQRQNPGLDWGEFSLFLQEFIRATHMDAGIRIRVVLPANSRARDC